MSSLAFDKQGRPFAFHRLARLLAVRVFSNPGGRGSCFPVHDDDGNEVKLDIDADVLAFREAVKYEPGQYRLDQLDEQGNEIPGATAAYATVRGRRSAAGDGDGRDLVLAQMAQSNAELAQTNADVTKTAIERFADVMHATAGLLHAPIKPLLIESREDDEDDDEEDEDDIRNEPPPEPAPWAPIRPALDMMAPHLPALGAKFGAFLWQQLQAFLSKTATPPPAAAPSREPASAPASASTATPRAEPEPPGAAAGSSATTEPPPAATTSAPASSSPKSNASSATVPATGEPTSPAASEPATSTVPATSDDAPRNAATAPTPEQWAHLAAIRERLSTKERAIAEQAIVQMSADGDTLAEWLAALSAMPIDDAVQAIRTEIAKRRAPRERG